MRFSERWLRTYVDVDADVREIAERLTMAGLEVEGVERRYPFLERVYAVEVLDVRPHPRADHLRCCTVSSGEKRYEVVCGAPNLRQGMKAPFALPGAVLPGGMEIRETTIRGERSEGMLCTKGELAMGDDVSSIWELPASVRLGIPLDEALGIDDVVLDVSVTPNRGDCLSVIGLAREIAAIFGASVRYPEEPLREEGPPVESLARVEILDAEKCPRYAARVVLGVEIKESPRWMRDRLESAGVRAINNVVDVTNYVMLEMGQPLHAFDYDRLAEHRIVVKCAKEGETFLTLDGQERHLFDDSLMICDGKGPVAIAGIMGGELSGIYGDTRAVLIESACFDPIAIRRTSRKLKLSTESSYRFERAVDPEGVIRALDRAAQLMVALGGGQLAKGRVDVYPRPFVRNPIRFRVERANRYLGSAIPRDEVVSIFERLQMDVKRRDDGDLEVTPPPFRQDITREVDLTEEVARIYGYEKIAAERPRMFMVDVEVNDHLRARDDLRDLLRGMGLREIVTYSFISPRWLERLRLSGDDTRLQAVKILNPLSEDQSVMRTSLVPSMLQTVRYNIDRQNTDLRLFELSKVFLPREGMSLPEERFHLVVALSGSRHPQALYREGEVDYPDVKGIVEAVFTLFGIRDGVFRRLEVGRSPYMDRFASADVVIGGEWGGVVGLVSPSVAESFGIEVPLWLAELDFERLFAMRGGPVRFTPLPKFPSVVRDLALVVGEEFLVQEGADFLRGLGEPLLEAVEVFDVFKSPQLGEGKKSVGYRLVYRSHGRSLTDEEVNLIHQGIMERITKHFGIAMR